MSRDRLVRRIETEARAYADAKGRARDELILGRVLGLLEAGVIEGYRRKRDAVAAGELVENRYRVARIRALLGTDRDKLWQASDVAAFLGITRQRVDQLLAEGRLPEPSRDGRVRKWERETIVRWAKDHRPVVWRERA